MPAKLSLGPRLPYLKMLCIVVVWTPYPGNSWADDKPRLVLEGRNDDVRSMVFIANGKLLVGSANDARCGVRIWDVASGKLLGSLHTHKAIPLSFAVSPDGKTIVTTGSNPGDPDLLHSAEVCDVATGKSRLSIRLRGMQGIWLFFSPDGKTLVLNGLEDETALLFDLATGAKIGTIANTSGTLFDAMVQSADGRYLACAGRDYNIYLYDVAKREQVACLRGHRGSINVLAFSADGKTLLSGGQFGTLLRWDVANRETINHVEAAKFRWFDKRHQLNSIWCLAVSPDGQTVALAGHWYFLLLWTWDRKPPGEAFAIGEVRSQVQQLAFSPDGKTLAVAMNLDGKRVIHLYDYPLKKP